MTLIQNFQLMNCYFRRYYCIAFVIVLGSFGQFSCGKMDSRLSGVLAVSKNESNEFVELHVDFERDNIAALELVSNAFSSITGRLEGGSQCWGGRDTTAEVPLVNLKIRKKAVGCKLCLTEFMIKENGADKKFRANGNDFLCNASENRTFTSGDSTQRFSVKYKKSLPERGISSSFQLLFQSAGADLSQNGNDLKAFECAPKSKSYQTFWNLAFEMPNGEKCKSVKAARTCSEFGTWSAWNTSWTNLACSPLETVNINVSGMHVSAEYENCMYVSVNNGPEVKLGCAQGGNSAVNSTVSLKLWKKRAGLDEPVNLVRFIGKARVNSSSNWFSTQIQVDTLSNTQLRVRSEDAFDNDFNDFELTMDTGGLALIKHQP